MTDLEVILAAWREVLWNVMDGYDESSPIIVERESWRRLRKAILSAATNQEHSGDG